MPSPERFRFPIKRLATFRPHSITFSWSGQPIAGTASAAHEYFTSLGTLSAQPTLSVPVSEPVRSNVILTRTLTRHRARVSNRSFSTPMSEDTKGSFEIK